jgi:hypothetical protein
MALLEHEVIIPLTGASATIQTRPPSGWLYAVKHDYTGVPGTTTVSYTEAGGAGRTIFNSPAGNTDDTWYPSAPVDNQVGVAVDGQTQYIGLADRALTIAVANSGAGSIRITMLVLEY